MRGKRAQYSCSNATGLECPTLRSSANTSAMPGRERILENARAAATAPAMTSRTLRSFSRRRRSPAASRSSSIARGVLPELLVIGEPRVATGLAVLLHAVACLGAGPERGAQISSDSLVLCDPLRILHHVAHPLLRLVHLGVSRVLAKVILLRGSVRRPPDAGRPERSRVPYRRTYTPPVRGNTSSTMISTQAQTALAKRAEPSSRVASSWKRSSPRDSIRLPECRSERAVDLGRRRAAKRREADKAARASERDRRRAVSALRAGARRG
jgi:hypothetical protein